MPKKPKFAESPDFTALLQVADQLLDHATQDQLAETTRLLALNFAHYKIRFGEIPLENFDKLMETQELDDDTARLVAVGMENLVGVLGLVTTQDGDQWSALAVGAMYDPFEPEAEHRRLRLKVLPPMLAFCVTAISALTFAPA